jgi:hypothetical protein
MDENTVEEKDPPIEVDESWKSFDSDPTPHLVFSKEIESLVDGEKVKMFIRLPNQWQHRKVQDRAAAARARMVMQLKEPDSDVSAVIQEQLMQIEDLDDDKIIEWLLSKHAPEAIFRAQMELESLEEVDANGKTFKPWESIPEHQERYYMMLQRNDTENDEFRKTEEFILKYAEALQERANHHLEPKEAVYAALDREGLMEKVRRSLCHSKATDEYINVYNQWQIYYGTRDFHQRHKNYFKSFNDLLDAQTGLIDLLTDEFATLDALKAGELGKSPRATSLLASLEQSEI